VTVTVVPALTLRLYQLVCPTTRNPGAVVPTETTVWFPVADTVTVLPDKPVYDTEPELVPANSSVVDACFDPDNVDVEQLFNNFIPEGDTDPVYDTSADVSSLIQPKNELVPVRFRLRSVLNVLKADYSTKPTVVPVVVVFRSTVSASSYQFKLSCQAGSLSLQYSVTALYRAILTVRGSYELEFAEATLEKSVPFPGFGTASYRFLSEVDLLFLAQFDVAISDSSKYNVAIGKMNSGGAPAISTAQVKFGAGSVFINTAGFVNDGAGLQFYLDPEVAPDFEEDFIVEGWAYVVTTNNGFRTNTVWSLDTTVDSPENRGYRFGFEMDSVAQTGVPRLRIVNQFGSVLSTFDHPETVLADTWNHVAIQRLAGVTEFFVNGVPGITIQEPYTLRNRNMLGTYSTSPTNTSGLSLYGYLDSFRILDTAVRDPQGFTVPTVAHSGDEFDSARFSLQRGVQLDAGSFTLTGQSVDFAEVTSFILADSTSYNLSTSSADFARPSRSVVAVVGTYIVVGSPTQTAPFRSGVRTGSSSFNYTMSWPVGYTTGDIGIISIETYSGAGDPLPPPGWQKLPLSPVDTATGDTGSRLMVFWKRATSTSEGAFPVPNFDDHSTAIFSSWRDAKATGNPFGAGDTGIETVAATSHTVPGLTTTQGSSTVLVIATTAGDSTSAWGVQPTNTSLDRILWTRLSTANNLGGGIAEFSGRKTVPGLVADTTVPLSASFPAEFTYYTIELLGY
jgi:hypothetical protein